MGMRTYGLSGSGIDVDQMVKDLMKARRASYDKIWQQKTQIEWKKKDFNTIYSLTKDFRDNTLFDFRTGSTLQPKSVVSTNDTVVSATATGEAANVTHSLIVKQLADGVIMSSSGNVTAGGKTKDKLINQFDGITAGSTLDFTINGKQIKLDVTNSTSIYDVVSAINNSGADLKVNYDSMLDRFFVYTNKTGTAAKVDFTGSTAKGLDFLLNKLQLNTVSEKGMTSSTGLGLSGVNETLDKLGVTGAFSLDVKTGTGTTKLDFDATNTLSEVLTSINTTVGYEAANYDAATGKVVIKSSANASFSIASSDADGAGLDFLVNKLKLAQFGKDAVINLDGVDVTKDSNSFQVSGVAYNLKAVSYTDGTGNPVPTRITVKPDIDKTIANIKSFIDDYNAYLTTLNTELNENRYRDFAPLTDEQRKEMKDSDIKAWEEKAKSGMLRRDPILSKIVSDMRLSFIEPVKGLSGKYTSAVDIGIGTGKYVNDDGNLSNEVANAGKLYVNTDTLRKALEDDPDIAAKIFTTRGEKSEENGVAIRLSDQLFSSLRSLKDEAGYPDSVDTRSNLAKQLTDYNKRLNDMTSRLQAEEKRYYKKFDAMESALSRMNQQSSWLLQQFSSK